MEKSSFLKEHGEEHNYYLFRVTVSPLFSLSAISSQNLFITSVFVIFLPLSASASWYSAFLIGSSAVLEIILKSSDGGFCPAQLATIIVKFLSLPILKLVVPSTCFKLSFTPAFLRSSW